MPRKWGTYDIPRGAGSRAVAVVGADAGIVYVTVADQTNSSSKRNTICPFIGNIMDIN
jgi:hypothetical protein